MEITLEIDNDVLAAVEVIAKELNKSLGEVFSALLRIQLEMDPPPWIEKYLAIERLRSLRNSLSSDFKFDREETNSR